MYSESSSLTLGTWVILIWSPLLKLWIADVCLGVLTTDKLWLLPSTSTHYYSECSKVARVGYAAVYNREKCLFLKLTLNCVVSLLAGASFCLVLLESDWLSRVGWWSCALASSLSPLHWRTSSSCWNDEVYLEKKKKKGSAWCCRGQCHLPEAVPPPGHPAVLTAAYAPVDLEGHSAQSLTRFVSHVLCRTC